MQTASVTVLPTPSRIRLRTALVASADRSFRQRLTQILTGLRWQVREAEGGAQAWAEAESSPVEAIIVDSWLPDLDVNEFLLDFRGTFPQVDLVTANGSPQQEGPRGPYRQELLYAMRRSQRSKAAPAGRLIARPSQPMGRVPLPNRLWPTPSPPNPMLCRIRPRPHGLHRLERTQ
jgi:CheY-like chemotaxis protein